jgi:hypothetical protein
MVNAGPCVELSRRQFVRRGVASYWRLQMDNGTGVKRLTVSGLPRGLTWARGIECGTRRDRAKRVNKTVDIADRMATTRTAFRQGLKFKRYLRAANEESTPCGDGRTGWGMARR